MFSEEQAEAWKSDEMFRLLVSGGKDYAIILLDDAGHVVRWNDGAQGVQGYKAEEIVGSHCSKFYTEEDIKAGKPEVELRLARIAGRFQDEGWRVRKDLSRFWASFEITALRDKEGTLTGFGEVVRDITDRKNAEERLRKSEEMFRLLVLGVKDYAIVMLNTDGQVVSWNEGAERIQGYSSEEILGTHFSRFYTKEDVSNGKPETELQIAAKEGRLEVEGWRVRKNRSRFRAHVVLTALHDDAGQLVGFGKVTRDITLQKEAEDALTTAKEQAEQASRFKSEFLANMSHEIRTPMNGIIGITNILLRSPLAEQQYQNLTILRDVGISLLSVINDILDFSKVEAGKLQLEFVDFEPVSLVEGIADFFAAQAKAANVSLSTHVTPNIPKHLNGDAGRLRQILTNLTSNAIKFSPNGEVTVKASLQDTGYEAIVLKFEVIDTGIGIVDSAMERIFSPFVQADGSTNRKYGGTGLGLSISKRLVELMGGTIGVSSQPGHGSNFWFTIPFEQKTASLTKLPQQPNYNDLKVLVVDDVSSSRKIIESYLSRWSVRSICTETFEEATRVLRNGREGKDAFSLVLINSSIPLKELITYALELIETARASNIDIVLTYGLSDSPAEQTLLDQYFPRRISKPVKGSELLACLGTLSRQEEKTMDDGPAADETEKTRRPGELLDRLKKILVVEDNQVNTRVILMDLEELGLHAEAVGNGVEALKALSEKPYDVVLMDCQMPEMDGFEATRLIREREAESGGHIPIIAMTAQAMDGDRERCLSAGMDDYLSKPIDFTLLERSLLRWIPRSRGNHEDMSVMPEDKKVSMTEKPVLVDLTYLQGKYNRDRMNELIQLFIDSSAKLIGKLEQAISEQNASKLGTTAHELAGSCMMLRMSRMFEEARCLEKMSRDPKWVEAQDTLANLKESFEATKETVLPVLK